MQSGTALEGTEAQRIAPGAEIVWTELDRLEPEMPLGFRVIGLQDSAGYRSGGFEGVDWIEPGRFVRLFKKVRPVYDLLYAVKILAAADDKTIIKIDNSTWDTRFICILNAFNPWRRRIVAYELYLGDGSLPSRLASKLQLDGVDAAVVWSDELRDRIRKRWNVADGKIWVIPFKSNHSRGEPNRVVIDGFLFSGGNSQRDYPTLIEAVRGTGVPLVISTYKPIDLGGKPMPENVIIVSTREPHFARMMAASRFAVLPIKPGLARGAGEASVCDSMWHGRPVVAANDASLDMYIRHGETGLVVPPCDVEALRAAILELWNDPERCREMGRLGHERVRNHFTVKHFAVRMMKICRLVARRAADCRD